jgi:transcriptional antiterminator NusG
MATITQAEIKKQIEDKDYKWYCLSVVAGQEGLVVENLKERVKKQWLEADIIDYYFPVVMEAKMTKGVKVLKEKKLYPGYVFCRSKMNDKIWYVVRNTPGVRIIVGAETHPIPITDAELANIQKQVSEKNERSELIMPYRVGDVVTLKDGNFAGTKGVVRELDPERNSIVVNVEMLGRMTPVMVDVEKVELSQ